MLSFNIAITLITMVYKQDAVEVMPLLSFPMLFPIVAGVTGAYIPARKAVLSIQAMGYVGE